MKKRIFGIVAGRRGGNCEIAIKEAFMGAAECGDVELAMVNLHECAILPCTGCEACTRAVTQGRECVCVHRDKDDVDSIVASMFAADGIVISVPCYELQPAGIYRLLSDRFLAYEVSFLLQSGQLKKEPERVAGMIAVGGSTHNWMPLMLPGLAATMFTQSIKVVDQMMVNRCNRPGQILARPEYLTRARRLGENVFAAMHTPYREVKWLGDTDPTGEWCPLCHSNVLVKGQPRWDGEQYQVECGMCGVGGSLEISGGQPRFVVDPKALRTYRLESVSRADHFHEIAAGMKFYADHADEIKNLLPRYRDFTVPKAFPENS